MRLSCQLRKYLSQFAACNGLALSSTRASRDRRSIGDLLRATCCCSLFAILCECSLSLSVPLILSPSSLHPLPPLLLSFLPLRHAHVHTEDNSTGVAKHFDPLASATARRYRTNDRLGPRDSRAATFACTRDMGADRSLHAIKACCSRN